MNWDVEVGITYHFETEWINILMHEFDLPDDACHCNQELAASSSKISERGWAAIQPIPIETRNQCRTFKQMQPHPFGLWLFVTIVSSPTQTILRINRISQSATMSAGICTWTVPERDDEPIPTHVLSLSPRCSRKGIPAHGVWTQFTNAFAGRLGLASAVLHILVGFPQA